MVTSGSCGHNKLPQLEVLGTATGMAEPVEKILNSIEQEGLQQPPSSLRSLRHGIEVAANYAFILERLNRLAPGSEAPRSELVNAIVRDLPMKVERPET